MNYYIGGDYNGLDAKEQREHHIAQMKAQLASIDVNIASAKALGATDEDLKSTINRVAEINLEIQTFEDERQRLQREAEAPMDEGSAIFAVIVGVLCVAPFLYYFFH